MFDFVKSTDGTLSPPPKDRAELIFGDCFVLFRALCKLSIKESPEDKTVDAQTAINSMNFKSKLLALELLEFILLNAGPVLKADAQFINLAIKKV